MGVLGSAVLIRQVEGDEIREVRARYVIQEVIRSTYTMENYCGGRQASSLWDTLTPLSNHIEDSRGSIRPAHCVAFAKDHK